MLERPVAAEAWNIPRIHARMQ